MSGGDSNLREDLKRIKIFADLEADQLAWLAERMVERRLAQGEVSIEEGTPADRMAVVIEGEFQARREKGPSDGWIYIIRAGEVSGMLPFSRMTTFGVTARAVVATHAAYLSAALFPEMLRRIPVLEARLVGVLTDRVRETTRIDQERDKLVALGKLSAGLAHELNNPAAAVQRGASELRDRLVALRSLAARLIECGLSAPAMQAAVDLYRAAIARSRAGTDPSGPNGSNGPNGSHGEAPDPRDPIAESDREELVAQWLEDHEVERPWDLAGTFAAFGFVPAELDGLAAAAPGAFLPCLVAWMEGGLAAESLLADISHAAHRITELVGAVKSYSHMDDGQGRGVVDLRREIDSTLTILAHKVRKKNVAVQRDFERDLPKIEAFPGELNQVWTNLLDNALDAVADGGRVTVRAVREGDSVRLDVADDGPGIPPDIQSRIWEPFFTTKPVGEGTGLGLEIAYRIVVRRHGGAISVTSEPGNTCFSVWLPICAPSALGAPEPQRTEPAAAAAPQ
jgi:signal transduction histidine kinase